MTDTVIAEPPATRLSTNENPYVGPRSLIRGEPIYGRSQELFDLQNLLIAERIVLLYSPSGAGKTSLIEAGLLPAMEAEEFNVLPLIRVGRVPAEDVRNRYIASALHSIDEHLAEGFTRLSEEELNTLSFGAYLEQRRETLRWESTLLVFDQFEEVLTADPLDDEAKLAFFNEIGEALRDSSRWALFTIRERYLAALNPYTRSLPTRLKSTIRLDLLSEEAAREAIEQPAAARGVRFTPEAVNQLVDDLREIVVQLPGGKTARRLGRYIEPVHLQVVCFRLWEKPREKQEAIGLEHLAATGSVEGALGEYYADRIAEVAREAGVKEKTLRQWFDRSLITEAGIRTEVLKGEGPTEGISNAAIEQLEAAHLIRSDERPGSTTIELAHDRLVRPIQTNNAKWFEQHLGLLQQQAALWLRQNRNEELCLRGSALAEAEEWARANAAEMSPHEQEFLVASREKESYRSTVQLRQRFVFVSSALLIAAVLATVAVWQWKVANDAAKLASTRGLAALAYRLLDERLDLAMLLAVEASHRMDIPETRGALLAATVYNPRLLSFLHGHQASVGALAFTPDAKYLAAGDYNGQIVFWNRETRRPDRTFPKFFKDAVRGISFSPDGKYMVASGKDSTVVLQDLATDERRSFVLGTGKPVDVWSVAFSPDSAAFATADSQGKVTIWDVATGTSSQLPDKGDVETRCVAWSGTGAFLAAGYRDGEVLIWQRQAGAWSLLDRYSGATSAEPERSVRGPRITSVAFHPRDDNLLVSGSRDWTVNLRHVGEKRNVASGRHWGSLSGVAFSPDGSTIASGAFDGMVRLWKVPNDLGRNDTSMTSAPAAVPPLETKGRPMTGHIGWVLAVAFSPDGRTVASGGVDREAILWDSHIMSEGPNAISVTERNSVIALHPAGNVIVSGDADGKILLFDRVSKKRISGPVHPKPVQGIDFTEDGRFMISCSSDKVTGTGTIIVSRADALETEAARLELDRRITRAALSTDGRLAAIAAYGGELLLWDVDQPKPRAAPLVGLNDVYVYALGFSSNGKHVAAGGTNQFVRIWDLDQPEARNQAEQHNGSVRALKFSPDSSMLATASGDNTLLLCNPVNGAPLAPALAGHRGPVTSLAFRRDGKMLASGGEDKAVVLWDVATRQQASPRLMAHRDAVRALSFSKADDTLLSVSSFDESKVWDLGLDALRAQIRSRANRNLTKPEWKTNMQGDYRKTWPDLPEADENVAPPSK